MTEQIIQTKSTYFFNRSFDKGRLKSLISWYFRTYGEYQTVFLLEELKIMGFHQATKAGISLSIDDLLIPDSKINLLRDAEQIITLNTQKEQQGDLTSIERFQHMIDTWHLTSETLKKDVVQNFRTKNTLNPVYMMAFSGARGNLSQVRQLVGMRGLMSDPQGQIIDFPITSNFREGLTLTEYVISCYGARKGIVDTALRTANSGYLTRRLVDVAQHVMVSCFDCGTKDGLEVENMCEGNKITYHIKDRILGRVLANDVKTIAKRNTLVNLDLAQEIGKLVDQTPEKVSIRVRSPLTCIARDAVCQLCYGWSLAHNELVSLGEAIGIIAAQSIGEPGTQLTMRTFHTGGVFSGDTFEQISAPFSGRLQYTDQTPGELIRTTHGKIAFLTKSSCECNIISTETNKILSTIAIPEFSILFHPNKKLIKKDQLIAEFTSLARQSNQRIQAKQSFKAPIEGQVFFEDALFGYQNEKTKAARQFGSLWLLSGSIQTGGPFFGQPKDFIQMQAPISEQHLISTKTGEVQTYTSQNQLGDSEIKGLRNSRIVIPFNSIRWANGYYTGNDKNSPNEVLVLWKALNDQLQITNIKFQYNTSLKELPNAAIPFALLSTNKSIVSFPGELQSLYKTYSLTSKTIKKSAYNIENGLLSQNLLMNLNPLAQLPEKPLVMAIDWVNDTNHLIAFRNRQGELLPKLTATTGLLKLLFSPTNIAKLSPNEDRGKRYSALSGQHLETNKTGFIFSVIQGWPYQSKYTNRTIFPSKTINDYGEVVVDDIRFNTSKTTISISRKPLGLERFTHFYDPADLNQNDSLGKLFFHLLTYSKTKNKSLWNTKSLNKKTNFLYIIEEQQECNYKQTLDEFQTEYIVNLQKTSRVRNSQRCSVLRTSNSFPTLFGTTVVNNQHSFKTFFQLESNQLSSSFAEVYKINDSLQNLKSFVPFALKNIYAHKYQKSNLSKKLNQNLDKTIPSNSLLLQHFGTTQLSVYNFTPFLMDSFYNNHESRTSAKNIGTISQQIKVVKRLNEKIAKNELIAKRQVLSTLTGEIIFEQKVGTNNNTPENLLLTKDHFEVVRVPKGVLQNKTFKTLNTFVRSKDLLFSTYTIRNAGQIIGLRSTKNGDFIIFRKGKPVLFSSRALFTVNQDDFIRKDSLLSTFFYRRLQTGDIVQGIPKIEEFFEARSFKFGEPIPNSVPEKLSHLYETFSLRMPNSLAVRNSIQNIQQYLVDSVQQVYQSQGVTISDKHLEIIVRQMTSKVKITAGGQTGFLPGELVSLETIELINQGMDGAPAKYEPILLGITKASLETKSFISAASFQETTRILARAAIERKTDFLKGLKENVILGHLIPAGTGFRDFLSSSTTTLPLTQNSNL